MLHRDRLSIHVSSPRPRASRLKSLSQSNVLLVVEIADSSLGYDRGRKVAL